MRLEYKQDHNKNVLEEQAVTELHDICLVDAGYLLAIVARRVVEGKLGDPAGLLGSDNLDTTIVNVNDNDAGLRAGSNQAVS